MLLFNVHLIDAKNHRVNESDSGTSFADPCGCAPTNLFVAPVVVPRRISVSSISPRAPIFLPRVVLRNVIHRTYDGVGNIPCVPYGFFSRLGALSKYSPAKYPGLGLRTWKKKYLRKTLVDRANDWLRKNRKWKIITCESVEFKAKGEQVDSGKMTYLEYGEISTWYIRGLRLWLTERSNESDEEQQIGFLNLTPRQVGESGIFNTPVYETLDDVISRFNSMMQSNPLPGRVITVESQEMKKSNTHELEPDRSNWMEDGNVNKHFLFVIRIFYEIMAGSPEEIGVKDFVPDTLDNGGVFSLPDYEPFSNVVKKASYWCSQQNDLRFCNAQSLEIKMKTGKDIDTKKMDYTEHGTTATFYVRILRIAYAKPQAYMNVQREVLPLVSQLTCKTFVPVQVMSGVFVPEYENLSQTKERVSAWIRATGALVVSAETVALRIMTGGEAKQGTEASFTFNRAERDEYWIFVIRLYLNGHYKEPPQEMLPPVPEVEHQSCCIIL